MQEKYTEPNKLIEVIPINSSMGFTCLVQVCVFRVLNVYFLISEVFFNISYFIQQWGRDDSFVR